MSRHKTNRYGHGINWGWALGSRVVVVMWIRVAVSFCKWSWRVSRDGERERPSASPHSTPGLASPWSASAAARLPGFDHASRRRLLSRKTTVFPLTWVPRLKPLPVILTSANFATMLPLPFLCFRPAWCWDSEPRSVAIISPSWTESPEQEVKTTRGRKKK